MTEENNKEKEIEELKNKCEEYLAGWQRAKADFINYEKDEAKRFAEVARFANENLIKELILILDSFELAAQTEDKSALIIQGQLENILRHYGLEKIAVKAGEPFRPEEHESLGAVSGAGPAGVIAELKEAGYRLHGKVIRPAKVLISK